MLDQHISSTEEILPIISEMKRSQRIKSFINSLVDQQVNMKKSKSLSNNQPNNRSKLCCCVVRGVWGWSMPTISMPYLTYNYVRLGCRWVGILTSNHHIHLKGLFRGNWKLFSFSTKITLDHAPPQHTFQMVLCLVRV